MEKIPGCLSADASSRGKNSSLSDSAVKTTSTKNSSMYDRNKLPSFSEMRSEKPEQKNLAIENPKRSNKTRSAGCKLPILMLVNADETPSTMVMIMTPEDNLALMRSS
jgi:hypothetical protein